MADFLESLDYTKTGQDIPENTVPQPGIYGCLEIYCRKFWQLIKLNMLFFLFNLPSLLILPFIGSIGFPNLNSSAWLPVGYTMWFYYAVGSILLCIPIITVGPWQAGFTYVLRNLTRGEHAFLWGDFKEHARKNLKQSIIICLIDLLTVFIIGIDLSFYFHRYGSSFYLSLINGLIIMLFMLDIMAHLYIYPMLVTFNFSIKQIYKNAFIFALIKFFPNLAVIAVCVFLTVIPLLLFPVASILLFPLITISTTGLVINFYVYPVLEKYIINKLSEAEAQKQYDIGMARTSGNFIRK